MAYAFKTATRMRAWELGAGSDMEREMIRRGKIAAHPDGTYELFLDYSLPAYRDYSIGKFLKQALPGEGIRELHYQGPTENHLAYLEKMDFRQEEGGVWVCRL